MHIAVEF